MLAGFNYSYLLILNSQALDYGKRKSLNEAYYCAVL